MPMSPWIWASAVSEKLERSPDRFGEPVDVEAGNTGDRPLVAFQVGPRDHSVEVRGDDQRPADGDQLGDRGRHRLAGIVEQPFDRPAEGRLTDRLEDPVGRLDVVTFAHRPLDGRVAVLANEPEPAPFGDERIEQLRPEGKPVLTNPVGAEASADERHHAPFGLQDPVQQLPVGRIGWVEGHHGLVDADNPQLSQTLATDMHAQYLLRSRSGATDIGWDSGDPLHFAHQDEAE